MNKADLPGMKADSSIFIAAVESVFQVAFNGRAYSGKLTSDLVVSAGLEANLQQVVPVGRSNGLKAHDGFFGCFPGAVV